MDEQQQTPEPKKRGRKPRITVIDRADLVASQEDAIADALDRRLRGAPSDLFGSAGSKALPLREPGRWKIKEANGDISEGGRLHEMTELGWAPVTAADLREDVTPEKLGLRLAEDGRTLVRGARGQLVYFKMPLDKYRVLERRKAEINAKGIGTASAVNRDLAESLPGVVNRGDGGISADGSDIRGPL